MDNATNKKYKLLGADGKIYLSDEKGTLGGNKRTKVYGRLDCSVALSWIAKGTYIKNRVFFKDEETALAAGYHPCANCMPEQFKEWKRKQEEQKKKEGI